VGLVALCVVKEAAISDVEAIHALYTAVGGEVWRAMLAASGGRAEVADEATAEAFKRLCQHWKSVREPRPWLYRTAYRLVVDELRRSRRDQVGETDAVAYPPEQSALSVEVVHLLRQLPADQRLVVFLFYYADLPLSEIAMLTGSTAVAVRIRLHRARRQLRAMIEEASRA
jgi:RNA polymerase sigma-70 factor (ECF subfamily)